MSPYRSVINPAVPDSEGTPTNDNKHGPSYEDTVPHIITHEYNKPHDFRYSRIYLSLRKPSVHCRMYRTSLLVFGSHPGRGSELFSHQNTRTEVVVHLASSSVGIRVLWRPKNTKDNRVSKQGILYPIIQNKITINTNKYKIGIYTQPPHRVLTKFISARLFSDPQVANEVKRTPHCGCCWDPRSRNRWIEEGPNRAIFGRFSETLRPSKSCIYAERPYFEF